jgi:hypothetical protein
MQIPASFTLTKILSFSPFKFSAYREIKNLEIKNVLSDGATLQLVRLGLNSALGI